LLGGLSLIHFSSFDDMSSISHHSQNANFSSFQLAQIAFPVVLHILYTLPLLVGSGRFIL
jgi:hypothetical protein